MLQCRVAMAADEEIIQALESLLRDTHSNPSSNLAFSSLNGVVQQLEAKLGVDLADKVDFIRAQIQLLFRSQKDPFAPHHTPNFHHPAVSSSSSSVVFRALKSEPTQPIEAHSALAPDANVSVTEVPKDTTQIRAKRRGGPGGLNKLCGVSPELQAIVGQPELPRTEIVKQLWAYIRKNNLQDPSNKRKIICNDELRLVFETDCTDMFKMNKLLAKHILPLEPAKEPAPKKVKIDAESGTRSTGSAPSVMISEALANFFGVGGREMLQSEVMKRIWEYIKVSRLEDPVNSMVILCDAKLRDLFGCESISALGIPQVLAQHHIFPR